MKFKIYWITLSLIGLIKLEASSQVSFNKRATTTIGDVPNAGTFLNGATLDNVDMSTGTLKVGIPLYEIKVNDISVPITLNYSATGIKVNQEAGAAGMGWELSAGGKIITNQQGKTDNPNTTSLFNYPFDPVADKQKLKDIIDGKVDNAWDIYNYILPNGGGTFAKNGLTFPYDPMVRVDMFNPTTGNTIKTTDGLVYSFEPGDRRVTSKLINYSPTNINITYNAEASPDTYASAWYDYNLATITSTRFKDVVKFKYKHFDNSANIAKLTAKSKVNISESLPLYRNVQPRDINQGGIVVDNSADRNYTIMEPIISTSVTSYVEYTRLDTIDFSTGKVVFEYAPQDVLGRDVLTNLCIYRKVDNAIVLLKRFEFIYGEDKTYGHYLRALKNYDAGNQFQDGWQFGYKTQMPVIPNSNGMGMDRWGFYNGANYNMTLIEKPTTNRAAAQFPHWPLPASNTFNFTRWEAYNLYNRTGQATQGTEPGTLKIEFADRNVSSIFRAEYCSLAMIITPTGATYEYYYEPHRYSNATRGGTPLSYGHQTVYETGGGIRIASIIKRRGHDNLYYGGSSQEGYFQKTYSYGSGTITSENPTLETNGIGYAQIPQTIVNNISTYYDTNPNQSQWTNVGNMILLSHPLNDMSQMSGSYVMYKSVTENVIKSEAEGDIVNKTVYFSEPPSFDGDYLGEYGSSGVYSPYQGTVAESVISAPFYSTTAGVNSGGGAGIVGYKKYGTLNGSLKLLEDTRYEFKLYRAPDIYPRIYSMFASITGQLSGPYPNYNSAVLSNPPQLSPANYRGNTVINIGVGGTTTPSGGNMMMDHIAKSLIVDQDYTIDYPGKFMYTIVDLYNRSYVRKKVKETTLVRGTNGYDMTEFATHYKYDNTTHLLPTSIIRIPKPRTIYGQVSKQDSIITNTYYVQDYTNRLGYPNYQGTTINKMITTGMGLDIPLVEYTAKKSGSPQLSRLTGGTVTTVKDVDGAIVPNEVYKVTVPDSSSFNMGPFPDVFGVFSGTVANPQYYKRQVKYDLYHKGQIHQYVEADGKANVIFYGYKNQYPIAKVTNAGTDSAFTSLTVTGNYQNNHVAYTSFEGRDTCNWAYDGAIVPDATTISGKSVYQLNTGAITKINDTKPGNYILSYWAKNGAAINVTGGTIGAEVKKNSLGPWSYIERQISSVNGALTIAGTGYIDELRFYPKNAQMSTYVYEPLVGLTTVMDANGKPQFYDYDNMQRLLQIRDYKGNVIKAYRYIIGSAN